MPRKAVYKHKLYLSLDNILVINFGFGSCGSMSQAKIWMTNTIYYSNLKIIW